MNQFWNKTKVSFALLSALSLFTYTSCSSGGYSDDTLPLIPQPTPTTTAQTKTQKAVTVTAKGAVPVMPPTTEPWGQRTCYIADPKGNLIEIGSFVKE